jgi:hypothetical protein
VAQRSGKIVRSRSFAEPLGIPAVAYDGSPGGLSADGRTLVLIRQRTSFPQARTRLAVLDTAGLGVRRRLDLRGDFSFDAISPDGRTLFFIEYQSRVDPTRYQVRAYDVPAGRLEAAPVVDPREPGERMGGRPVTRAASADGRWAYTLYDRPGGDPFVHALDTTARRAVCIDMPLLAGRRDFYKLRLRAGAALTVLSGRRAVAQVDVASFRVSRPRAALHDAPGDGGGGFPWVLAAALLGAGALATGVRVAKRPSAA